MLQQSLDYIGIPVKGKDAGTVTASMLAVSFTGPTGPFVQADKYTYDTTRGEWPGLLEILVGPGSQTGQLAVGPAQAYVQIIASPTRPVLKADSGPYIEAA